LSYHTSIINSNCWYKSQFELSLLLFIFICYVLDSAVGTGHISYISRNVYACEALAS